MYNWMWPMMGSYQYGSSSFFWQLQWLVVWGLTVALLVAAVRWVWKKGNK